MALHELHPYSGTEIVKLPEKPGVYVLFQVQLPLHADGAKNLRQDLLTARAKFPAATHFSAEPIMHGYPAVAQRLSQLREELTRVRTAGFIGSRPAHS